jgi:hypothetical protein
MSSAKTSSATGTVAFAANHRFNGVRVFSATMMADRDQLGEKITAWLGAHPELRVTEAIVTQSSDAAFHCLAITLFYWEEL